MTGGYPDWFISGLSDGGDGSRDRANLAVQVAVLILIAVDIGGFVGAVSRDVARLAATVAALAGGVQGAATGSSAVARDVAELATSIALHGLSLAIAGIVVRATALVAGSGTGAASKAAAAGEPVESPTADGTTTA
jgi:hypothetical protein